MYKLVWDMRICVSIPVPDVIPETSSLSLLIVSDNKLPLLKQSIINQVETYIHVMF